MKTNLEYQRLCRQRKADGIRLCKVEVEPGVIAALVKRGWMGRRDDWDKQVLADVISDLLDCWRRETLT